MVSQDLQKSQAPQGRSTADLIATWDNLCHAIDQGLIPADVRTAWCKELTEEEGERLWRVLQARAESEGLDWTAAA